MEFITGGRAAQLLLLVACSRCQLRGLQNGRPCPDCADSIAPGYHMMRCPLPQLIEAVLQQRAAKQAKVKSPAERLLYNALDPAAAASVINGYCPDCGADLQHGDITLVSAEALPCPGTCGHEFLLMSRDDLSDPVILRTERKTGADGVG